MMILVLNFALLSAVAAPFLRGGGLVSLVATLALPLSPALLAILIALLDREGPAKFWLAGLLASLFFPALVAWFDVMAAWVGMPGPKDVGLPALAVLNALGVVSLRRALGRLPGRCGACGRRSLLPLSLGADGLRWCASCGLRLKGRP
jgi:hypothetical protein